MPLAPGHALALRQLWAIEAARPGAVEIVSVGDPGDDDLLPIGISLDCAGIEHVERGIRLRQRERFVVLVPQAFPFDDPYTLVGHTRWEQAPHVQWRVQLCLYQAPSVEWLPSDGMYGYIERLFGWLEAAAVGQLDPEGGPLHPPVTYRSRDTPVVIPRADTPAVGSEPWLGYAVIARVSKRRLDLTGWPPHREGGKLVVPPEDAAAAILLTEPLSWEFPRTVGRLLLDILERGVELGDVLLHLGFVAAFRTAGEPLFVVVGTPMRGTAGGERRQHLTAWQIPADAADRLTVAIGRYSDEDERRAAGKEALGAIFEWFKEADADWCWVREARPEIVERRDSGSPLRAFAGRSVAVWGCGALGGPVAEWIVRAGARRVVLYDNASVGPGLHVRQLVGDSDIGESKARALAQRLEAIGTGAEIEARWRDVVRGPLAREDWHDGADIVIDATASVTVQAKLEQVRRLHPQPAVVIALLIGHTAEHGIAAVLTSEHTGATADALRAAKLKCSVRPELAGFLAEFWPAEPRRGLFQPEPGCSSPTFRGSGAEVAGLAGALLAGVAHELVRKDASAVVRLLASPDAVHKDLRSARLPLAPALTFAAGADGYEVRLSRSAAASMRAVIRSRARAIGPESETGGVMFGQRDAAAGVIWIDEVSGPPPGSIERPEEFVCGTAGVARLAREKETRSVGALGFLGIWHTHPDQPPAPSARDLAGMLELLELADAPAADGLIVIAGHASSADPELAAYTFTRERLDRSEAVVSFHERVPLAPAAPERRDVGLALSGGGSRAIAFHLGCLRALHDLGVLDRVQVVSGVSGGSVLAALWAYTDCDFATFDQRVQELLWTGMQWAIARRLLLGRRGPQALATTLVAGSASGAARAVNWLRRGVATAAGAARPAPVDPPLRRWVSRTDAFRDVLAAKLFGNTRLEEVRRDSLGLVLNACDLRTGSAFRFGSRESGTWRLGIIPGNDVDVATAVAASAAYPLLLPALDRIWSFERRGTAAPRRVVLTDGGVFDNLGTSCLEPGRDPSYSTNVYDVDYVIACDAGRGLLSPTLPYAWPGRVGRSFESTFRKVQDAERGQLHSQVAHDELAGFVLPYLGQQDDRLPERPEDLVPRSAVATVGTNFASMPQPVIDTLTLRGEQLTRLLVAYYCPELLVR